MKLIYLMLILTTSQLTASVYSQNTRLNLDLEDATLSEVFKEIKNQSEFTFLYNSKEIESKGTVDIDVSGASLEEILEQCLNGKNLKYKIVDKTVILSTKPETVKINTESELLQKKEITGKVTDKNGESIPGVSVLLKGTTTGIITDLNGNFKLSVPNEARTLVFSFVGMKSQEVNIDGQTVFNIQLEEDAIGLEEVVAIGYGSVKKSDLTGAVSSVKASEFESQPITKVDQALQGRVAGVNITQTSGDPAAAYKIRIRGVNSINFNNDPLYVVDGLIVGDINTLNINDVQSIDVLKDASATAIYGSRGANGVIIITTKNGKKGGFKLEFDYSISVQNAAKEMDMLSAAEYAEEVNTKLAVFGNNPIFTSGDITELKNNGGTDWQDLALKKNATISDYQIGISGGNENTDYYISLNYLQNEGIIYDRSYDRFTSRIKVNSDLGKNAKVGMNVSLNRENIDGSNVSMTNILTFDLTSPIYNEEGGYNLNSVNSIGNIYPNSYITTKERDAMGINNKVYANLFFELNFAKYFTFHTNGGLEYIDSNSKSYLSSVVVPNPSIGWGQRKSQRLMLTNQLTYDRKMEEHKIKFDLVQEFSNYETEGLSIGASDLVNESLGYNSLESAGALKASTSSVSNKIESYMLRGNYQFANKYFVTITGRADGSSNFLDGYRWGFFPSVGGSWIVSEENFIKDKEVFDFLKLRVSYGSTGNQNIGNVNNRFLSFANNSNAGNGGWPPHTYAYPVSNGQALLGVVPTKSQIAPTSTWEKNNQTNIGVEMGMLEGRLFASIDLYKKISSDLLLARQLPSYAGITTITDNIGELENKGVDFVARYRIFDKTDFKWNMGGNISVNRNKVLDLGTTYNPETGELSPIEEIRIGGLYYNGIGGGNVSVVAKGKSLGQFIGLQFDGIYQQEEEAEAAKYGLVPGDPRYIDTNTDGRINNDDRVIIGSSQPDFIWGFTNDFTYKRFNLNVLMQGKVGGDIYNLNRALLLGMANENRQATIKEIKNRWTPENPSNEIPGYTTSANAIQLLSSMFLEDASFVSLKTVSLSYDFPKETIQKLKLQGLKAYVSGSNLFTITNYKGYDPEVTSSGNSDIDAAVVAEGFVPIPQTYTFGVKLTF